MHNGDDAIAQLKRLFHSPGNLKLCTGRLKQRGLSAEDWAIPSCSYVNSSLKYDRAMSFSQPVH